MATDKVLLALAADIRDLKKASAARSGQLGQHSQMFEQVIKTQADMLAILKDLQVTTSSLASATGLAMSELAVARGLERRIERLEAAVFPSKH